MICLVIPCYIATEELKQLTIRTVESMRKTSDVYVVCVDDGSPLDAGFLDEISDHTIHLKKNSGFAVAVNTGIKWALTQDFEYIGQANNDIEVFDGWDVELLRPFKLWDDAGITGLISSKERIIEGKPIWEYQVPKITDGGLLNHWMQAGGLLLVKRTVWESVGLYDEQFKIGGEEDVDLFHRIFNAGYKIIMSGYSCFWHKEGATRWNEELDGFREKNKAIEQTNYDKFSDKWGFDIRKDGLRFHEEILEERGNILL